MKINIKKFMELTNVSFETPAKIEAGHDVGKSTIFRAVLFAITGKDVDGKEFDGRIYPKAAKSLSELDVEVEIEQSGIIFCKKANGTEKRQKGSDETELQRSVTATYLINYHVVGKAEYDARILDVFGNFQLFANPDHFRNLKKEDKRAIFASLVKLDKNSYFDGLSDKKTVSGRIKAQETQIAEKNANLAEYSKVQEPVAIETVDYDSILSDLRTKRQNAVPELSPKEVELNNQINSQISELENSTFIPSPLLPLLPEPEKPVLINVEALQKELERVQLSEPNTDFIDDQIERMKVKIAKIKSLLLQIENYDENVKNAKCTLCEVCAAPDCQFKRIEVTPLDELQRQLSNLMPIEFAEKSLENLETQKIDYLRSFEAKKESEIARLKKEIKNVLTDNDTKTFDFSEKKAYVNSQNDLIQSKNDTIKAQNAASLATFEADKSKKIAELKQKIATPPPFDYSEIDAEISKYIELQKNQNVDLKIYHEELGTYKNAQKRIKELTEELNKLKQALYASERELIKIEDAENRYYDDFESKINAEMPENVRVSLFKKNLSNDERSEVFEIEFNGSVYAGNGKTIAFYIWLCSWFQSKFEKNLPIFIDEAIILNESLYRDVKNTVILMRNDNCKTLKISML